MSQPPADSGTTRSDRLAIFSVLWALATLLHQASYAEWAADPADMALTLLAVAVLLALVYRGRYGASFDQ